MQGYWCGNMFHWLPSIVNCKVFNFFIYLIFCTFPLPRNWNVICLRFVITYAKSYQHKTVTAKRATFSFYFILWFFSFVCCCCCVVDVTLWFIFILKNNNNNNNSKQITTKSVQQKMNKFSFHINKLVGFKSLWKSSICPMTSYFIIFHRSFRSRQSFYIYKSFLITI